MGILFSIGFGVVAGALKLVMPGKIPGGVIVTILIETASAVIWGFLARALGYGGVNGFDSRRSVVAIVASLVALGRDRLGWLR